MTRRELLIGLFIALLLRVGFTIHAYHKDVQPTPTGVYEYEPIARGLLASGVYSDPPGGVPTARREPGYILFVALVYKLFTTHRMYVFLVQCALSALTAWILYGFAVRAFNPFVARFSFWACVFYPYFIYYAGYFFREDWIAFLLASMLYVLARWPSVLPTLGAGFLAGWLTLSNGAWALGCGWAVLALAAAGEGAKRWTRAAAFALPLVLMVGAWGLRNYRTFGAMIPFSSVVGGEIYIGMTIPYDLLGTDEQTRRLSADARFQEISKLDEIPRHQAFMAASKDYFLARPAHFVATMVEHSIKLWRLLPHDRAYTHSYFIIAMTALGSDGWLIPLGLFGLWINRRHSWSVWFFLPMLLLVTGGFSISQAPIRYRVPLMVLVIPLAGAGAQELWKRVSRRA